MCCLSNSLWSPTLKRRPLQEQYKALRGNVVETEQISLGLVLEVRDPVDVVLSTSEPLRMVDSDVVELGRAQGVVAVQAVAHDAVGLNHLSHDEQERPGADGWNHHREHLSAPLQQAEHMFACLDDSPSPNHRPGAG